MLHVGVAAVVVAVAMLLLPFRGACCRRETSTSLPIYQFSSQPSQPNPDIWPR